jgi:hypothetical protein
VSCTHEDASSGRLSGYELASPVFGLGHKSPLELLALARGLLLLLLGVIGRELGFLPATEEGNGPPKEDDEEAREEGEDTREEEAPPLPDHEAAVRRGRLGRHVAGHRQDFCFLSANQALGPRSTVGVRHRAGVPTP